MIALTLRDVAKSFGAREVFSGVSASVGPGCLVVTGPNGSGKSTLLRIIAGLIRPSCGEVVFSRDAEAVPAEMRREMVGLVAPDLALYDELSAVENLRFFARVRGIFKSDGELKECLVRLGLEGREDDSLSSYSSGMRQRVKYAFATLHNPPMLLLDEPSANLDEAGISAMESIIENHKREGIVVIATNLASELAYGDHVLQLGPGVVCDE